MRRRRFIGGSAAAGLLGGGAGAKAAGNSHSSAAGGGRKRVLFLAIDGMDPAMINRHLDHLPNMRRMISGGYSGRILPYVSCWGNIDFMSMMTGAAPGTQYRARTAGGGAPRHQKCVSETIWQALSSEGRRSALLGFQGAAGDEHTAVLRVPMLKSGSIYQTPDVVIEGLYSEDLETTGWPPGGGPKPGRRPVVVETPKPAGGWTRMPPSKLPVLETQVGGKTALVQSLGGDRYDVVVLYSGRNGSEIGRATVGEWSDWKAGKDPSTQRDGVTRYRLLELSPDGKRLQLLESPTCALDGFSEPGHLAGELSKTVSPIWSGSAIPPAPDDPFWEIGEAESAEGLSQIAKAALALAGIWDWEFFLHKASITDTALHQCLTLADPTYHGYDPAAAAKADHVYRQAFIDLDTVIGRILAAIEARGDTVLIVASDHGGGVNNVVCDVNQRLRDVGLLTGPDRAIDFSRTRAYTKRSRQGTEIFVNLKGREPEGIVEPEDLEKVQEAVIDALLDWRGPIDKKRAVTYALKLRDAALIGYWGPEAGDVQFCYNPGFVWGVNPDGSAIAPSASPVSNHGPQIVTGETGYSSMMGQMLAWGPGVAKGVKRDEAAAGPIPIASVAPTLSRLLGCRTPADSQLGPIEEMLA